MIVFSGRKTRKTLFKKLLLIKQIILYNLNLRDLMTLKLAAALLPPLAPEVPTNPNVKPIATKAQITTIASSIFHKSRQ